MGLNKAKTMWALQNLRSQRLLLLSFASQRDVCWARGHLGVLVFSLFVFVLLLLFLCSCFCFSLCIHLNLVNKDQVNVLPLIWGQQASVHFFFLGLTLPVRENCAADTAFLVRLPSVVWEIVEGSFFWLAGFQHSFSTPPPPLAMLVL